jgi:hypothetical protein
VWLKHQVDLVVIFVVADASLRVNMIDPVLRIRWFLAVVTLEK